MNFGSALRNLSNPTFLILKKNDHVQKNNFSKIVRFLGRNGMMKQSGITVGIPYDDGTVEIAPITGKGKEGRAYIQIPYEDIPQVTGLMLEAYNKLLQANN